MDTDSDHSQETSPEVFLDNILTTIIIGEDEEQFHVHKALLCSKSGYFAAGYGTNMKEATSHKFHITDVSPPAFRSLVTWLYTGKVFLKPGQQPALHKVPEFQIEQSVVDEEFPEPWDDPEYDAVSETHPEKDYEYDDDSSSASFASSASSDQINIPVERTLSQEREAKIVHDLFPNADPNDLDSYQMEHLIRQQSDWTEEANWTEEAAPSLAKWQSILDAQKKWKQLARDESTQENSQEEDKEEAVDNFDRLLDLYIVADRFDVPLLRRDALNHLDAQMTGYHMILTGHARPSYAFVIKAYENLPEGCDLRSWLVNVFAQDWSPVEDTGEERRAARCELPRDFLFDLASTLAERGLAP
ncbi:uncharacterized protein RCC_02621 [Ramularia collo-cygni]|uniref:BTB domain-containing protein n=1 Tax=Ramularia collo-cygni TaxID=112498 RepID=A0A2D3UQV5_9PEZI|nr:uncharacterized protein RCC_02621 [Ramularia collo-cygni]CZT16788.1 uncharacterized protein RCC_02621 [Ramularia collo-cygni]